MPHHGPIRAHDRIPQLVRIQHWILDILFYPYSHIIVTPYNRMIPEQVRMALYYVFWGIIGIGVPTAIGISIHSTIEWMHHHEDTSVPQDCVNARKNFDMYGIGIRIATYLQLVTTIITNYFNTRSAPVLCHVNCCSLWALILASFFAQDLLDEVETYILWGLGVSIWMILIGQHFLPSAKLNDYECWITTILRSFTAFGWLGVQVGAATTVRFSGSGRGDTLTSCAIQVPGTIWLWRPISLEVEHVLEYPDLGYGAEDTQTTIEWWPSPGEDVFLSVIWVIGLTCFIIIFRHFCFLWVALPPTCSMLTKAHDGHFAKSLNGARHVQEMTHLPPKWRVLLDCVFIFPSSDLNSLIEVVSDKIHVFPMDSFG